MMEEKKGKFSMSEKSLVDVDLKPAADVANNIINKFAQAIGWSVVPRGNKKDMEIAVETYINEIQGDTSLPPLVRAAKISNARKEIKEYVNLQDILQHAQEFGKEYENNNEELDEDWTMFFYDRAKNVSYEDAKILWGRILAEECNLKGSIPKQLMHILSVMNKNDADAFQNVCGFIANRLNNDGSLGQGEILIGSGDVSNDILYQSGLSYQSLNELQALGLVMVNAIDNRLILEGSNIENGTVGYKYHQHLIRVEKLRKEFPIGYVLLTRTGIILSGLIVKKELSGFLNYIKSYYEGQGFRVTID